MGVMVENALNHVLGSMRQSSLIEGLFRLDIPEYPELALREAIVNAVAHRDYSHFVRGSYIQIRLFADRLEIQSPGGLYGNVTIDNLDVEQSTRNRTLMRILEDLHLSENRGSGVPAMIAALRAAHLEPPGFDDRRTSFWVTFRNHTLLDPRAISWLNQFGGYHLNDNQRLAMVFVLQHDRITNSEYRRLANVDMSTATRELRNLCSLSLFVSHGTGRWTSYSLVPHLSRSAAPISEHRVLEFVRLNGAITNAQVQSLLGIQRKQSTRLLVKMRDEGLLRSEGTGRWTVYHLL